jgi:hypothetical protein
MAHKEVNILAPIYAENERPIGSLKVHGFAVKWVNPETGRYTPREVFAGIPPIFIVIHV